MKDKTAALVAASLLVLSINSSAAQTSPDAPTPLKVTARTNINIGEGYATGVESVRAAITVLEIVRGERAWEMVRSASASNRPPDSGMEYLCVRIRFEFGEKGSSDEGSYGIREEQFASVAQNGKQYDRPNILLPKPQLNGRLYPGESLEGWIALLVNSEDRKPLMTFGNNYARVWFKLF